MKRNNRGRPPGSKNIEYKSVTEVPPACKRCGCTTLATVGKPPIIRQITGVHSGQEYNRVTWTDKECTSCGQRCRVTSYQKTIANSNTFSAVNGYR